MDLRHLIFLILFSLSTGVFLSFGFVREKEVGAKYYLIHGLIVFGTSLLSYLFLAKLELDSAFWFFIHLACVLALSFAAGKKKALTRAAYFTGGIAGMGTIVMDITLKWPPANQGTLMANTLMSMGVMGFSMAAMLLGHWYLTQPKMSIEELKRVTLITILLLGLRFFYGTYGFGVQIWGKPETEIYRYLFGGTGVFVLMRWVWGLLAAVILSYFIWQTVKIRSTQSATGLLYILVLFVMTGEILSQYLAFFHGIVF